MSYRTQHLKGMNSTGGPYGNGTKRLVMMIVLLKNNVMQILFKLVLIVHVLSETHVNVVKKANMNRQWKKLIV